MNINCIKLENFRNYKTEQVFFCDRINVIYGENAQGKTNLLEAVSSISTMKLFRTGQKREGLRFGQNTAKILGEFTADNRNFSIELKLFNKRPTEVYRNGVKMKRQSDVKGILKTVLFCPDDLYLIRAGASARRKFLDTALCQLRPNYDKILSEYERVLAHKNKILKDSEEKPEMLELLDDFSLRLAHLGAIIIRYRAYYIRKLSEKACQIHKLIAPNESLNIKYKTVSTVNDPYVLAQEIEKQLVEHVIAHRRFEIASKSCLSGPHKDDLEIMLNDVSASSFGSQGQIRTCALALKLAEREMFFDDSGEYPVLLLDDVLSELDAKRQDFVLNRIDKGQVLITCCDREIVKKINIGMSFYVQNGHVLSDNKNIK